MQKQYNLESPTRKAHKKMHLFDPQNCNSSLMLSLSKKVIHVKTTPRVSIFQMLFNYLNLQLCSSLKQIGSEWTSPVDFNVSPPPSSYHVGQLRYAISS